MQMELINGDKFGNWEEHQAIEKQETELLERLHSDLCLREQLYLVTEDMLSPGLVLIYPMGKNGWGAHCLRSKASGYRYNPQNDIRGATRAGLYYTLP